MSLRSAGRHRPTALARSVAYHTMRGANNPPKKGRGPHAPAPLCSAPLAWSLPWCSAACPMLCINSDCVCPTPSRKPRPFSGGLTARIMCGCGRARRARLRGLRGLRCQRCAQTRTARRCAARATGCRQCIADRCDYAACVWPCPPPGAPAPVWRLRCAWPTGAWSHAHRISAIVLGAMGYGGYDGSALRRAMMRGRLAPPSS